jgi:hypothetical protein
MAMSISAFGIENFSGIGFPNSNPELSLKMSWESAMIVSDGQFREG